MILKSGPHIPLSPTIRAVCYRRGANVAAHDNQTYIGKYLQERTPVTAVQVRKALWLTYRLQLSQGTFQTNRQVEQENVHCSPSY